MRPAQTKKTASALKTFVRMVCVLIAVLVLSGVLAGQSDDLLTRIWDGVGQAQKKYRSMCGNITETRTSSLMTKPLVLHGKFCAEGMNRFALEYVEPSNLRIRVNDNYVNVKSGDKTEVTDIGKSVQRAESYFGRENSLANVKKQFNVTVQEDSRDYQMRLVPRTNTFRDRLNYLIIKLDKRDFLLRSLEVDGKSRVNSVFLIDINSMNPKIPADMFEVYKPR